MDKIQALKEKYLGYRTDTINRLDELAEKDLWDLYAEREIHLRYIDNIIGDLDEILIAESCGL